MANRNGNLRQGYTIDDLAQRVGMTVRNLREWKTLGLLPRAEMRGRVGYYDDAVVERIEGIKKLHADGFTLELIRRMLDAAGDSGDEVMRFADQLRAPYRDESTAERIARVGETLRTIGMDDAEIQAAYEEIREHADGLAALFERVWLEHIWKPFVEAGTPEDELPQLQETLSRVQPLALEAVTAIFTLAMESRIEQSIDREVQEAAKRR